MLGRAYEFTDFCLDCGKPPQWRMQMKKISPYTTVLDAGNAYWMARIAKEVYLKKSEGNQIPHEEKILENLKNDDPGFVSVFGIDKNSAQAALVGSMNTISVLPFVGPMKLVIGSIILMRFQQVNYLANFTEDSGIL